MEKKYWDRVRECAVRLLQVFFSWIKSGKTWNSYSAQEIRFTLYIIQKQAYMKLVTGEKTWENTYESFIWYNFLNIVRRFTN